MAQVLSDAVAELRSKMVGDVVTPEHAAYEDLRKVWNGAIDRRPAVIARPLSAQDVSAAVLFGREQGLPIAIRGGGHAFSGSGVCEGGLMIHLGAMNRVVVDPESKRATAQGGATWADIDAAGQEHGLAVTGGFISHTGIGGLTLGGGMGWLTRKAGLSIDNLLAAEVVTAAGDVLRASADENSDLFWALRGGGGNFGVVTSFEFGLHEVGPLCQLGLFFWTADRGQEALRFMRDYLHGLPEEFGVLVAGLNAPPAPFVPEQHRGVPGYAILVAGFGDAEAHAKAVEPIRGAGPSFEFVTPIPYVALQQLFNEGNEWGVHGYEKALYLDELTDDVIDVFTTHLTRKRSPASFVPVFVLDGAYARVGEDETAFGGSRSARFGFNIAALAPAAMPELLAPDTEWVRAFWDALRPLATNGGSYVNFMAEYDEDRVRASYGPAKYDRLARIKARYDPENVFRLNQNIKPRA